MRVGVCGWADNLPLKTQPIKRSKGGTEDMPAAQHCSILTCGRPAVANCFECDAPCCARHITTITLAMSTHSVRVSVCPECLHQYSIDPEIQPLLKIDTARLR